MVIEGQRRLAIRLLLLAADSQSSHYRGSQERGQQCAGGPDVSEPYRVAGFRLSRRQERLRFHRRDKHASRTRLPRSRSEASGRQMLQRIQLRRVAGDGVHFKLHACYCWIPLCLAFGYHTFLSFQQIHPDRLQSIHCPCSSNSKAQQRCFVIA